jgi:hypothetical protein
MQMRIIDAAHGKLQSEQTISSDLFVVASAQFPQAIDPRLSEKKLNWNKTSLA